MRIAFRNFTGGEVTASLSARYDLQKYGSFLSCCENFIPNPHGDIERRPGTEHVAELGGAGVLIPFQFNTEPANNYALIFQEGNIKIAREDGLLADVNLPSPYSVAEAYELSTAQAGDLLYMAHRSHPLRKIIRSGEGPAYDWSLEEVAINRSLEAPEKPEAKFVRDNGDDKASLNYTLSYVVTAVDGEGVESLASEAADCEGKFPTDWVTGNHVDLSWQAVAGAESYNIYRDTAGYYGLIGVADGKGATGGSLAGIRAGDLSCGFGTSLHGTIERRLIKGNGHVPDVDETDAEISLSSGGNAFELDGHVFFRCKKLTKSTEWMHEQDAEGQEVWKEISQESEEFFWAMAKAAAVEGGSCGEWVSGSGDEEAPKGVFGPYNVVPLYEGATTIKFTDQNFEADTSITPKEDWNPFEGANNPGVVTFHQQRLTLGGTWSNPATFYMSRSGDFENFRKSRPLRDDDPIEYMLASGSIDEIRWLASFGDLLIGTSGAEYKASSSGGAITASDVQIAAQSFWGSSGLAPMIIGQSVLHCQRAGSHARDLSYSWESDGYAGNDLSLLAPHLVEGHRLLQWTFQQSPGSNIWIVRDDGVLLCLTYMKEQNIFAWSRHVTEGRVRSAVCLCGSDEDRLLLLVEREAGGRKEWYLERLAARFREGDKLADAVFLDCAKRVESNEAKRVFGGFSHLEGREVAILADGAALLGLRVKDGAIELPYAAKTVICGLNYSSVLAPLPVEADGQNGTSLGRRRAYGRCGLRLARSVGGAYAATERGDLFRAEAWKERRFYELPWLPQEWGEAAEPFSGDVEFILPGGQDGDASIWILQDKPLPFRIAAIVCEIDFGEQ